MTMARRLALILIGVSVCVVVVVAAAPGTAHAHDHHTTFPPPTHLTVGDQIFDGSVAGLRAYLDTTQATDPQLFAQLSPDLERLESRLTTATVVAAAGATVGLAAIAYSVVGRKTCAPPDVGNPDFPDFAAAMERWGACNDGNMQMSVTAGMIGFGALLAGGVGWLAIAPGRSDIMSFVSRHNVLGREPLRFQLGYDPSQRFAHGGVTFSF